VCGDRSLLEGPESPPAGAVRVPAGNDAKITLRSPRTTYWFSPGVHTFGSGKFGQIVPSNQDTYVGAPGAILDGKRVNLYAFTQHAQNVTIEHLTIEHFGSIGDNQTQGVVNHTSGSGWTIEYDTIQDNGGAGVMVGSQDVVRYNCLADNGQYGFSAYSTTGPVRGVEVQDNEVAGNDAYNWTKADPGCGCSGGAKFWDTRGAVVTGNYVHDNHNVGLWVDTDNAGFDISGNYISHNAAEGLVYEVSYNALISHNTFTDNAWSEGARIDFPDSAIYVSESGGDPRVHSPYAGVFDITDNLLVNNWGGVVLWENANRFCSDGSDGMCTLVEPDLYTVKSCRAHLPSAKPGEKPDYFSNCRWRTMNVRVSDNRFKLVPKRIPSCSVARHCGYNGIFSNYGTAPPYHGWVVASDISNHQHNEFTHNHYVGPWRFDGFSLGAWLTWKMWRDGAQEVLGHTFAAQDRGSTYTR